MAPQGPTAVHVGGEDGMQDPHHLDGHKPFVKFADNIAEPGDGGGEKSEKSEKRRKE